MATPAFKQVTDLIFDRLTADEIGYNANYANIRADYGAEDATVNFSDKSYTFYYGRIGPDALEKTSAFRFPFCTIDLLASTPMPVGQRLINGSFSGRVTAVIEIWFSWQKSAAVDFLTTPMAIGDALTNTFNDISHPPSTPGIVYGGDITVQFGQVRQGGYHWIRNVVATLSFEVYL